MSDEVDVRVTVSLDPSNIAALSDYDDDTRPLLGHAETTMSEAYEALKSIHDAKAGAAKNPTLNEYAQLVQVDDYATRRMGKVVESWGRSIDVLNANVTKLEKELYGPVEQRATASMASEIRAHFKGMDKESERFAMLRRAISEGDDVTVTAVLGGRPYLSGIDAETSELLLKEWNEKQRPLEAKKLRAMKATADLMNDRYPLFQSEWAKAVGTIDVYQESKDGKRQILVKRITAKEVREQVRAANEPFSVPV